MLQITTDLLGSMITAWILFYAVFKFSGNKINYKSKKFWLCLIGYAVYMIVIYKFTENFIRVLISYFIILFMSKTLLKQNLLKTLISVFLSFFIFYLLYFAIYSIPKCLYASGNAILPLGVLDMKPIWIK